MTEIYETQSERTDLPLVVMPAVLDAMIEPIKAQFPALHDVAPRAYVRGIHFGRSRAG